MRARGCSALVVATLDDIAWLLNLRGSDVPHCPVFLAYALVTATDATLYVEQHRLEPSVVQQLKKTNVKVEDPSCFYLTMEKRLPDLAGLCFVLVSVCLSLCLYLCLPVCLRALTWPWVL